MAKFDASYTTPTRTAAEVSDGARAAFQNDGVALFNGLGLRDGGFQANANRVFILDDKGKLVTPAPHDPKKDNDMTAAAQDGRLYVMDKNYRLRQVRLEGNENDGFAFAATNPLNRKQLPTSRIDYYFKRLAAITDDFVKSTAQNWDNMKKDMARIYTTWKQDMAEWKQDMAKIWSNMKEDWTNIWNGEFSFSDMLKRDWGNTFSRRDQKTEQVEAKVDEGPLVPEDEPLETQQTGSTLTEEQIQQSTQQNKEKTVEDLLKTNPTKQTTPEFERYLDELGKRASEKPVEQALNKEGGKPADYYEGLAQELEGKIAGKILDAAPKEANSAEREKFLDGKKHLMASISNGLRDFVNTKVNSDTVKDYYAARAAGESGIAVDSNKMKLQTEATRLVDAGANEYMKSVVAQNEAAKQTMQQSQPEPNQVVQQAMQMQQPQVAPQPPVRGGPPMG